jgi:hypothetical protein
MRSTAMNEQQLREFGAHAEDLVEIPDLADLERKGARLQVRRRVSVATALAVVLTVAGVTFAQTHRPRTDDHPVHPTPSENARPYRGGTMKTLDEGTYALHPSFAESSLTAEFSVPRGWNSWVGPNRFDGHAPGRSNDEALGHLTWYVGALVLEVDSVNTDGCGAPVSGLLESPAQVVTALGRAFSMEVTRRPEQVRAFGYPATRLRMRVTKAAESCRKDTAVFHSSVDGYIQYAYTGTLLDVWVLDVQGLPIYVQKAWTPNAPRHIRDQLDGVVGSIRISSDG